MNANLTFSRPAEFDQDILIKLTIPVYQQAFLHSPVWQEDLDNEEIAMRLQKSFSHPFDGLWMFEDNQLVGASWYEYLDLDTIELERGHQLRAFLSEIQLNIPTAQFVYQAETIIDPKHWSKGYSKLLKSKLFKQLQLIANDTNPIILFTRMREDNVRIIAVNIEQGMLPSPVTQPSSQKPGINHHFWYQIIR